MSAATHPEVAPEHSQHGTSDVDLKAGRRKVARSRGVLSGVLLLLLGAWAALAPFIGPYFDFGFDPRAGDAWHWTSGRGLYEVLPGGVTALAGIVLLVSASRVMTVLFAWLAALAGVWLVIAPNLSTVLDVAVGSPPESAGTNKTVALALLYFFATGAAIALVAGIALGRLSVHSVRDVRAAERRAELEAAAEAQREEAERREAERRESERRESERLAAERQRAEHDEAERRRHDDVDRHDFGKDDQRTAALAVADGHRDETARNAPTAEQPVVDDDRYAAPPAAPYGQRDAAGSSSYGGHRSMGQHSSEPAAAPTNEYRAAPREDAGAHAVDPATPETRPVDPATPPPPGGVDQYRYGTPENPVPPEEPRR